MNEHLVYSLQTGGFSTWVTPATWIEVDKANVQSKRNNLKHRLTGAGRDQSRIVQGAKPVNGPISTPWWPVGFGTLLRSFMRNLTTTPVDTGVYDHALLFDDTVSLYGLSLQQQHSAALARNALGAVISKAAFSWVKDDWVYANFDCEAKDDAIAGSPWDYNGATSPALITPTDYDYTGRYYVFSDCAVTIGGTPSINGVTNKISIAGGTAHSLLHKIDLNVDNGVKTDGFGIAQDATRQEVPPGNRVIGVSLDRSWTDLSTQLMTSWRAGTEIAFGIDIVGPIITGSYRYEAHIMIPALVLDESLHPDISGDQAAREQSANGEAKRHATVGQALGIWIRTSEATI